MTLSIRGRLTLWYTAVLSLVLATAGVAFFLAQWRLRLTQLDEELVNAEVLVARALPSDLDEGEDLAVAAVAALEDLEVPGRSLAVFDAAGTLLSGRWEGLPRPGTGAIGERATLTVSTPSGPFRVYRERHQHKGTIYQIAVAESLAPVARELSGLRRALLSGTLFALILSAGGGWWIARQALQPVAAMAAQARAITDRTPGFRLATPNPQDELGLMAGAFNDLLARLEAALSSQRRFMADASHELRTPVSIAQTAAEVTLGRPGRPEDEYRDALSVVAAQTRRLARMVEEMLFLARADAAGLPLTRRPLYLDELVADCVKEAGVLASPGGVRLDWQGPRDQEAFGDEQLLRQMLMNLLHNAVRHTPPEGSVRVELSAGEAFEIAVRDAGGGIPEPDRERVFERFVRLGGPHRPSEGVGLGLPIARAIAAAHGGTLVLARSDATGSTFLVRLPRSMRDA